MLNISLTGGIASGKSTVARMFQEKGAILIDFDELTHFVEEPDRPGWKAIVDSFGSDILNDDRTVNRQKLGAIVFNDQQKLAQLNRMIHPAVFAEWEKRIAEIKKSHPRAIVISDVPLLIEVGIQQWFNAVILVYVSSEKQIQRLIRRNEYSLKEAKARLDAQMPISDKIPHADFIIDNGGPIEKTKTAVELVWQELLTMEQQKREGEMKT